MNQLALAALLSASTLASADLASDVADAHGRGEVPADHVFDADATVMFGGNTLMDGADLMFHPNGALVRIEGGDHVAVFDGKTAYVTEGNPLPRPRFQLLTWPYFAVMAYKLDDGGATLEPMDDAPLRRGEEPMRRAKLTFADGTGDSPDDWYVLYLNADDQLVASAYIVTYGKPTAEAEAEPHAIVYEELRAVEAGGEATGVVLSPTWTFYNWTEAEGLVGEPIGEVRLEGLRLIPTPAEAFTKPAGAREVEVPE